MLAVYEAMIDLKIRRREARRLTDDAPDPEPVRADPDA